MPRSLPPRPSLEQLKNQAKDMLKAHKSGDAEVCQTLRLLYQFSDWPDHKILAADVSLAEAQFALAMEYGFKSWNDLKLHVQAAAPAEVKRDSLERLSKSEFGDAPIYMAQMVKGYVRALNHAGMQIDVAEFAAASGWAFSFGYKYDDISPAFLALRGSPAKDGPHEVFRFLPERLGYEYEGVRTAEKDRLWEFVRKHIDAGTPVLTEQWDGGLFYGYRQHNGKREVWFVWDDAEGQWLDIDGLQPYEACVLVKRRPKADRKDMWQESLRRAVRFARPHDAPKGKQTIRQGMKALQEYLKDVQDPRKDFAKTGEWFCWAAFSRLCARACCATWLRSAADAFASPARGSLLAAAEHYGRAGDLYERYRQAVGAGTRDTASLQVRARTSERIAVIGPLLEQGIAAEQSGLDEMIKALEALA